jgi:hypothetical protein
MSKAGKRSFRLAASLVAAGALTFATPAAASTVVGAEHGKVVVPASWGNKAPVIDVTMTTAGFDLPDSVHSGFVTFRVGSPEDGYHAFQGLSVNPGYTLDQVIGDFELGGSAIPAERAQGHRNLLQHATLIGGVVTTPLAPLSVTIPLDAGTYYFFDQNEVGAVGSAPPTVHTLTAHGKAKWDGMPGFSSVIGMSMSGSDMPMFQAPDQIDGHGSTLIYNDSDELHEAVWVTVKDGTTDAYIADYYNRINNGLPRIPAAWTSTQYGLQAMSPGRFAVLHLDLPPSLSALLCLIPDDETGFSHARMGMFKVMNVT